MAFPRCGSSSTVSRSNWNLEVLTFVEGGKPEHPEKTPQSKETTNNKLNPHMTPGPGIEPGTHWTLLPRGNYQPMVPRQKHYKFNNM